MNGKTVVNRWPMSVCAMCAVVGAAILALAAGPARADSGRDSTTPTAWSVFVNQTPADVSNSIAAGYRLVCLKVSNGSGPTFNATYVSNTGAYNQTFWWYYGLTASDVTTYVTTNNARLISVESYDAGGGTHRFAVVMVSNTGANAKAWYWYYNTSTADLGSFATTNNARIVYFASDPLNSSGYNAVMISNTGADANSWYYYTGVSASFINTTVLGTNGQRIISLDVADPSGPTFNIATEGSHGQRFWWYYGQQVSDFLPLAFQLGARIFDIEKYSTGSGTRYAVVLLDNSNALTDRIGDILRSGTDGLSGCYLKQVNGPVLAALNDGTVYEPASSLKAWYHLHTLLRIQAGAYSLSTNHTVYSDYSGSCPLDTSPFTENLQTTLNLMMMNSDNARAQSIRALFGQNNLNNAAAALGMTNTLIQHRMGCGGDPPGDFGAISHPNQLTLDDLGLVYENAATGILNPTYKPYFYSLMDHSLHSDVQTILNQEAASLGVSTARRTEFTFLVSECYKGGNYGLSSGGPSWYDQTRAGWIKIPHRNGCGVVYYEYVYGTFVNNASNDSNASSAAETAFAELTREQLHAGLATYACIGDFNNDGVVNVTDIFAFIGAWFAGLACADIDGVGGLTVSDIFAFIHAWFIPCP